MAQGYAYEPVNELLGNNATTIYGTVTGVPSSENTIMTYTVPAGKTAVLKSIFGEGGTDGLFTLYINAVAFWQGRNAWTQRSIQSALAKALATGDIVQLTVKNQKSTNHTFTGGVYVYEL